MFPWLSPLSLICIEEPERREPEEVLILLPAPADAAVLPAAPVTEDAFPTAAALDALRAEIDAAPDGPDLALRQDVVALLGLDPAVAADEALYEAVLAALPPPAAEPDPMPELSPEPFPAWDWAAMSLDWGDPSRGWILG